MTRRMDNRRKWLNRTRSDEEEPHQRRQERSPFGSKNAQAHRLKRYNTSDQVLQASTSPKSPTFYGYRSKSRQRSPENVPSTEQAGGKGTSNSDHQVRRLLLMQPFGHFTNYPTVGTAQTGAHNVPSRTAPRPPQASRNERGGSGSPISPNTWKSTRIGACASTGHIEKGNDIDHGNTGYINPDEHSKGDVSVQHSQNEGQRGSETAAVKQHMEGPYEDWHETRSPAANLRQQRINSEEEEQTPETVKQSPRHSESKMLQQLNAIQQGSAETRSDDGSETEPLPDNVSEGIAFFSQQGNHDVTESSEEEEEESVWTEDSENAEDDSDSAEDGWLPMYFSELVELAREKWLSHGE